MKTLCLIIIFSINVYASEFIEGKDYVTIHCKNVEINQKVMHFFSFGCGQCFMVNQILKEIENIDINASQVEKCHVYCNPFGKFLSKAWVLANQLGVSEKVDTLFFKGVENQTIIDERSVKDIFLKAGVEEEVFNEYINNPEITAIVEQQARTAKNLGLYFIPTVIVGNRFSVKLAALPWHDRKAFSEKYSRLINELLSKVS